MSIRSTPFIEKELYHVYNRGVDKRVILKDGEDYTLFVHYLYVLNNSNKIRHPKKLFKDQIQVLPVLDRDPLVKIHCFCLMPNHFHLILEQIKPQGISKFMQKLGTSYTMVFNSKYDRSGSLFQGKFKAKHLNRNDHFLYLPQYIHLNPLPLSKDKNRARISNRQIEFLENYRWSSFMDYIGKKNFPSVIELDFLGETLGDAKVYHQKTKEWLENRSFDQVFLEINDVAIDYEQ